MKGSALALVSCLAAIASYIVQAPSVPFTIGVSVLFALVAAWWRGRPVLLLIAYILAAFTFVSLPQGLPAILLANDIDSSLFTLLHQVGIALVCGLLVGVLFALSCRRQSGGLQLSAQEASEDLEKLVCFVGRLTGLLYIPLFCLPLYLVFNQSAGFGLPDLGVLSWREQSISMNQPQVQIFSWLFALIALGGLASAYMSNAHHRYPVLRKKQGDRTRAWLEFFGATLLLLPLCWWMIEMGWVYSHQIQHYPEASPHILRLLAVGNIPIWGLYAVLPFAMVLLACSAISVMLRSMVYLFGPSYLLKRASTHLELSKERQTGPSGRRDRNWGDQIET